MGAGQGGCCASDGAIGGGSGLAGRCAWSQPQAELTLQGKAGAAEDQVLPSSSASSSSCALAKSPGVGIGGLLGVGAAAGLRGLKEIGEGGGGVQQAPASEDEDEDEDEDDEEDEALEAEFNEQARRMTMSAKHLRQRAPIFSEQTVPSSVWIPPVHPKSAEQKAWLKTALSSCFLFAQLSGDALANVILAFQERPAGRGERIIVQGADVGPEDPALFVLEEGRLEVFKDGGNDPVFTYDKPGQYFGDLALLYNAPRAATVVAGARGAQLWCIDRNTYNALVRDACAVASKERLGFLREVPLFKGLTPHELASLCDSLWERDVDAGTVIVRRGDQGRDFFIVERGECEAQAQGRVLCRYGPKTYFGELALLRSGLRAVDVVAVKPTRLLMLDAAAFTRLLGPLEALLEERATAYGDVTVESIVRSSVVIEPTGRLG